MAQNPDTVSYLTRKEATEIDELLMGPLGFGVDQLMELAGLSVATAIAEVYGASKYSRVLTICGPGNNGGDGLVAARHLHHFGYRSAVCYPKRTPKPLYGGLATQLESLSVPFLSEEDLPAELSGHFDIIVDAIFGFSFKGAPRSPFESLIQRLVSLKKFDKTQKASAIVVSIDIPSGWHVEEGDITGDGIKPDMLVSLTAPKLCAKKFVGQHHFLGGRFVPPIVVDKFKLQLPSYSGTSMCALIEKPPQIEIQAPRENYLSTDFLEEKVEVDPFDQLQKWIHHAVAAGVKDPNLVALSTAGRGGKLSSRMVQLLSVDNNGFLWFTSYENQKGRDLSENPHASILFYWDMLKRQVRVEGSVEKLSDEESEQYFHKNPREIRIRSIASEQSIVVPGRQVLHQQYEELKDYFDRSFSFIPKPTNWGGYRLKPEFFEFWQGEESRVHLKLRYFAKKVDERITWTVDQLTA
ncbi:unnamed protein product [Coffea canephora]|uniref:NAD(P)H-hydrate epimerase n=1 Tax=Coffea canephora TaxID=49390 RepID=A0A068U7S2_COFCA|nr:unnamed protein product [Coffea canephora]